MERQERGSGEAMTGERERERRLEWEREQREREAGFFYLFF
jgi:hypothetical protein